MAAAAVFKGWEGGVCTHPHFISNTNPKKFDFLISKQYQIWSQNPENFKILRFDKFFGCVFWPKKDKNGQNVMDIVMQVWVCKSVRVCYTNVHTAQWRCHRRCCRRCRRRSPTKALKEGEPNMAPSYSGGDGDRTPSVQRTEK